jgi:hypothetical protein
MCSSFQIRCTRLMFTFQPPNTSEPVSTRCVRSLPCLGNVSTIFRHQRATRGRRLPSWDGDAACRGSGRAPDRPFFPRPFPAPRSAGRIPPSDGDARGGSACPGPGPPAVVLLLADTQPSADIGHRRTLPKVHISLPKQAHDLLCTASLFHPRTLSSPTRGTRILSQDLDQDLGRGSLLTGGSWRFGSRSWPPHRCPRAAR